MFYRWANANPKYLSVITEFGNIIKNKVKRVNYKSFEEFKSILKLGGINV